MHCLAADAAHDPTRGPLDVLNQEHQILEQLTDLALGIRQALIGVDVHTLETLTGRQEQLVQQLLELEKLRQALMKRGVGSESEVNEAGEEHAAEVERLLLTACEVLRTQMREFQRANAVNQRLLTGIARWTEGLFQGFIAHFQQVAPYDSYGSRPVSLEGHLLIDRQA